MIKLTRMDGASFVVNSDLIEFIEEKPETIISLTTGKKVMVRESADEVIEKVSIFRGNGDITRMQFNGIQDKKEETSDEFKINDNF